jgi:hypothetical protein
VAVVAVLNWVGLLLIGLVWILYVESAGDLRCEHSAGNPIFGELRWSRWPPGPTCVWTKRVHGFDEVWGPGPLMSIWLLLLAALAAVAVATVRWARAKA